jgi:hypothetical protein
MKSSVNKFSKGLVQDVSDINESNESYSDSMNGSLVYNNNGNYDWVVKDGNKFSFKINADSGSDANTKYIPIGFVGDNNIKILYSTYDTDPSDIRSEIGIFSTSSDGVGTYKTLFNDRTYPVDERLNFLSKNQITARFLYENENIIRVYWVDGIESDSNRPRSFTFKFDGGDKGNATNYSAVTLSPFSINSQSDFRIGILSYVKRINGNLKTGCYQYAYRLITESGYATPWTTPTKKVFLTSDGVSSVDWSLYEMEGSGLDTSWGNEIIIRGVDARYKQIEVCYIYSETPTISTSASIFEKKPIGTDTDIVIKHISLTGGTDIIPETIAASFAGINAAKTLDIKGSLLYYGNIIESENVITDAEKEDILKNVTITPHFRRMRSDEYGTNRQQIPLTHQNPKNGTISRKLNQDQSIELTVDNDYVNYKGTQVDSEFTGYWRGETYRYVFVAVDKVGIPLFAVHLADFTFPEQCSTEYAWKRLKADGTEISTTDNLSQEAWFTCNYTNDAADGEFLWDDDPGFTPNPVSYIRIMGIEVSGIDISNVKNKISGFHIARADRDATILAQGMVLPTVKESGQGSLTKPFPFVNQRWQVQGGDYEQVGYVVPDALDNFLLRNRLVGFYAPDYDFDSSYIPTVSSSDRLRIVGTSFDSWNPSNSHIDQGSVINSQGTIGHRAFFTYYNWRNSVTPVGFRHQNEGGQHSIQKQYYTENAAPFSSNIPYPRYLNECKIVDSHRLGMGSTVVYDPSTPLTLDTNCKFRSRGNYNGTADTNPEGYTAAGTYSSLTPPNDGSVLRGQEKVTTYYEITNFSYGDNPNNSPSACATQGYFGTIGNDTNGVFGGCIANYVRPNDAVYGGLSESSLEGTRFYSTGHFQPVNNPSFAEPVALVYNNIEVFGGDCYLDYFSFLRTYPRYTENPNFGGTAKIETDFAHGVVMPYESDLNHTMRQAPSANDPMYSHVGARPQDTYEDIGSNPGLFSTGLFKYNGSQLLEEFNVNSVLLLKEVTKFFTAEPQDFSLIKNYPTRWRYTGSKIYGDIIDTWRQFFGLDFKDLNGSYGQITASTFYNNQIYSFQEKAFGRLRAQDRAIVNTTLGGLTTGTGESLDGIDYISNNYGCQHQFSIVDSGRSVYWVDVDKRKAMRFAGDGKVSLSDVRGLHTFFKKECENFYNQDSPAGGYGICGVFDYENNDVMWTFVKDYHRAIGFESQLWVTSEDLPDTYNRSYYANNSTVFINGEGLGSSVIFPEGESEGFINKSVVYYVANKEGATDVVIKTSNATTGLTDIATIFGGEYYEVKRDNASLSWTATIVDLSDITPNKNTVVYNEDLNAFQGFFAFRPTFYMNHRNFVLSHDKDISKIDSDIYIHNVDAPTAEYYTDKYKSYVTLNVNEDEFSSKVFDSIRLNTNKKGYTEYSRFLFNTEKQYYYYDVQSDTRLKYLEDSIRMPVRTLEQKDRSRGKWINFIFEFKNNDDISAKIYNLITNYRISNRF